MRSLYLMMEDVATMPLRSLTKQLLRYRSASARTTWRRGKPPLGLSLAQDELAGLLGGSAPAP